MADALHVNEMHDDLDRYHGLLEQAESQIAFWSERADHLRRTIESLDRLVTQATGAPAPDGGVPQAPADGGDFVPVPRATVSAAPEPAARGLRQRSAPVPTGGPNDVVAGGGSQAPRGTDALRLVLESEPGRAWSLAELIDALATRGWLPTSRRPEEGVRISLKRLGERGIAVPSENGRWVLADAATPTPGSPDLMPEAAPAASPPGPDAPPTVPAPAPPSPIPPPPPRHASFGRPVGATITEL